MMTILVLAIGLLILGGGAYYLVRDKWDRDARKVYLVTTLVGAAIVLGDVVKIALSGL